MKNEMIMEWSVEKAVKVGLIVEDCRYVEVCDRIAVHRNEVNNVLFWV